MAEFALGDIYWHYSLFLQVDSHFGFQVNDVVSGCTFICDTPSTGKQSVSPINVRDICKLGHRYMNIENHMQSARIES